MSGGSNTSTSVSIPTNPTIEAFINQTIPKIQAVQESAPLVQFTDPNVKQIAGLSPLQQYAGALVPGIAQPTQQAQAATSLLGYDASGNPVSTIGGTNTPSVLGQLASLTGGEIGSSPATQAGMQAFQQNVLPTLQNELGAMGLGRSGIAAEQIQKAATSAAVPLIQQEIANRQSALQQYPTIAAQLSAIGQQGVQNLGTAASLGSALGANEQKTAQNVFDATMEDFLRRQQLAQGTTTLSGVPYTSGSTTTQTTSGGGFFGK